MLNFRDITLEDAPIWNRAIASYNEISSENAFANLLIWQKAYGNMIAEKNGNVFIKSGENGRVLFRLPIGGDMEKGIEEIIDYCCGKLPIFWNPLGEAFHKLPRRFSEKYNITPTRDSFDYIYSREDLATLSGKKYHSKRNHISAFSKKYDWEYAPLTPKTAPLILACAEEWYSENSDRLDKFMLCEKQGINTLISHAHILNVKGGVILVGGKAVAFCLGTPVNREVFDIHIEKALPDYAEAYSVINREFALKELEDYKYINREDDLGLEGLRRAKLSYKPKIILEKYLCTPKEQL